jgi:hypothetical protein
MDETERAFGFLASEFGLAGPEPDEIVIRRRPTPEKWRSN